MVKARESGILAIAASLIAVIRLRGEPIKPSLRLSTTIADSVDLIRMVPQAVERTRVSCRNLERAVRECGSLCYFGE